MNETEFDTKFLALRMSINDDTYLEYTLPTRKETLHGIITCVKI